MAQNNATLGISSCYIEPDTVDPNHHSYNHLDSINITNICHDFHRLFLQEKMWIWFFRHVVIISKQELLKWILTPGGGCAILTACQHAVRRVSVMTSMVHIIGKVSSDLLPQRTLHRHHSCSEYSFKVIYKDVKPFWVNRIEIKFSHRPLKSYDVQICDLQCQCRSEILRKCKKKILGKEFGSGFYIGPPWSIYKQSLYSSSQEVEDKSQLSLLIANDNP